MSHGSARLLLLAFVLGCDADTSPLQPGSPESGAPPASSDGPAYEGPLEGTVYEGSPSSQAYAIELGSMRLDGELTVTVTAVEGSDCVYDYLAIIDAAEVERRIEAEDPEHTQGDSGVDVHAGDNRWWRQSYSQFSGGQALVALKSEWPQPLVTKVAMPAGEYRLLLGSFTGDPSNGPFSVRVHIAGGQPGAS